MPQLKKIKSKIFFFIFVFFRLPPKLKQNFFPDVCQNAKGRRKSRGKMQRSLMEAHSKQHFLMQNLFLNIFSPRRKSTKILPKNGTNKYSLILFCTSFKNKKMHLFHDSVVASVPYGSSDDNLLTDATSPNTCNERGNGTVVTWRRK